MAVTPNDAIEERRREIQNRRKAQKAKHRKAALKRFFVFLCIVAVITLAILSLTVFFPVEKITVESKTVPEVYTPFNDDKSEVTLKDGICNINLPEKCSYAILRFNK